MSVPRPRNELTQRCELVLFSFVYFLDEPPNQPDNPLLASEAFCSTLRSIWSMVLLASARAESNLAPASALSFDVSELASDSVLPSCESISLPFERALSACSRRNVVSDSSYVSFVNGDQWTYSYVNLGSSFACPHLSILLGLLAGAGKLLLDLSRGFACIN